MKSVIKKILVLFILVFIFYLLFREAWFNWEKIKQYEFIFDYQNLLISYLIFFVNLILFSRVWHYTLKCIEPSAGITKYESFKVMVYARLGKYIPGKIWNFAGRIYLGSYYNTSKKALMISSLLQTAVLVISGIILGVSVISLLLNPSYNFLYLLIFPVIGLIALLNPKYFYKIINLIIKKIGRKPITESYYLNKQQLLFLYLQTLLIQILNGTAVFFMIRSFVEAPGNIWLGIVGITVFSNISGVLAVFSPGGIGVREGVLAFLLKFYYPISLAVLISLLARLWLVIGEGAATIIIFAFDKTVNHIIKNKQAKNIL